MGQALQRQEQSHPVPSARTESWGTQHHRDSLGTSSVPSIMRQFLPGIPSLFWKEHFPIRVLHVGLTFPLSPQGGHMTHAGPIRALLGFCARTTQKPARFHDGLALLGANWLAKGEGHPANKAK